MIDRCAPERSKACSLNRALLVHIPPIAHQSAIDANTAQTVRSLNHADLRQRTGIGSMAVDVTTKLINI